MRHEGYWSEKEINIACVLNNIRVLFTWGSMDRKAPSRKIGVPLPHSLVLRLNDAFANKSVSSGAGEFRENFSGE